jgi:hypothetical protein
MCSAFNGPFLTTHSPHIFNIMDLVPCFVSKATDDSLGISWVEFPTYLRNKKEEDLDYLHVLYPANIIVRENWSTDGSTGITVIDRNDDTMVMDRHEFSRLKAENELLMCGDSKSSNLKETKKKQQVSTNQILNFPNP